MKTSEYRDGELVVFVHGFGGKLIWMKPLSMRLGRCFPTCHFGYSSCFGTIDRHGVALHKFLTDLEHDGPLYIVAHSMGAIVARAAIGKGEIPNLKRMVMLAPPNGGSPVATVLSCFLGWASQPLRELSTDRGSYVKQLTDFLPCETGIVAAKFDALVPMQSTRLSSASQHVSLNATHNSILFSATTAKLSKEFLVTGRFDRKQ